MSRQTSYSDSLTLAPSGYTGLSSLTTTSSYPVTNGYTNSSSSTYARFTLSSGSTGYLYYTFDTSDLPSAATVDSVSCTVKARVSSTSRVTSTTAQLYAGTTAKGSSSTFASTSSSNTVTLTCGSWSLAECADMRLRIGATGSSGSGGGSSRYIYFYGATLTIAYSVDQTEYEVTISNSTSATCTVDSQYTASGEDATVSIDDLTGVTVTDNGTDVTGSFVQATDGSVAAYPASYTTSGSISGTYYQSAIGQGSDASASTGNCYCSSGSGSTAYIDYSFDFSAIPASATIKTVTCTVKGHAEDTSQSSEVATVQCYSGSTAKGSATSFTSESDAVYTLTVGDWTYAELQSAVLRFTIGYYGGNLTGATWTVAYEQSGYVYTIASIAADHAIVVSSSAVQDALYVKDNGSWVAVSAAYVKSNGAWSQVAVGSAFSAGANYVRG